MICHALPGRLRLRLNQQPSDQELSSLTAALKKLVPSAEVAATASTGSVLITYREKERHEDVLSLCSVLFPRNLPKPRHCRSTAPLRWPPMKQIKRGMSLSLLASLALLAVGSERGHGAAGSIFLALLARHIWVYRKRLI
jgi:hypothetical protein